MRSAGADRRGGRVGTKSATIPAALLAAATALGLLVPAPAAAQDGGDEPELGWRGNADLGFTLTEGNSETTSLSVAARVARRLEGSRWTADASLVRTTTDGEVEADRGDVSLQYDWFASDRSYLFARAAASYNEPAGIDLRLSPAAGMGWQALERPGAALSVEGGVSWIRDEFADGSSAEDVFLVASESFYLQIADDTELSQTLTWEPNTSDFGDFLLEGEVALSTMITEALGLKVSLQDQYDSEPFLDPTTGERREKNDLTFLTGITFRF